jgi:carbon-monoxide dehydrogenase small subunit
MLMTGRALLDGNPDPSDQEIREAICGTLCRCTGYAMIVRSIRWAAEHPADGADAAGGAPAEDEHAEVSA